MSFTNLPSSLGDALAARGYTSFTSVQQAVLEPEAAGRDLIVSAQTGSGKTVAFGLACAPEILGDAERLAPAGDPLALVIAPTRELALQVQRELEWLYEKAGARVIACVGGMDIRNEQRKLAQGAHIVVGTPGRLRDHLERGKLGTGALRTVVLDEADEMLDMGFREELEEILDATPDGRRTLLFSATMPKPIAALARAYQRDALKIVTTGTDRGHGDIAYQAIAVAPNDIEHSVVNLLRFHESDIAIVFCATRESVRRLHASLIERGFDAVALSGEHSQNERNHAMQALRDRRARVCVATDVAARGIDLPDLRLVIHADIPRDAETLQHRSGRTGRAGKKGTAVLIVPFTRRKRVEGMLRGAKIAAEWIAAPSADDIRARDNDRLVEVLLQPVELDETDRQLAARLLEKRSAEDIAAALVRMHRAKLPQPEDLLSGAAPQRRERGSGPEEPRPGFEDSAWFRMSVGRRQKADARWLLPLLCRRGHITKREVGAIRIGESETYVQIPRIAAKKFSDALKRSAGDGEDADVRIEAASGPPAQQQRGPRAQPNGYSRPKGPGRPQRSGPPRANRKMNGPR
ncbi:MAG TPA: DEAD/DEAH box helicase [Rhizorhapis sp.]